MVGLARTARAIKKGWGAGAGGWSGDDLAKMIFVHEKRWFSSVLAKFWPFLDLLSKLRGTVFSKTGF